MNNTLTIAGRTLTFQVLQIPGELISDKMTNRTDFYEGTYTHTYKKWGLFGETITEELPKLIFSIDEAITNPKKSKEWWQKELTKEIELLDRKEEIERGEFI
jgi:hypothetical protein